LRRSAPRRLSMETAGMILLHERAAQLCREYSRLGAQS